ncbi:MAG: hypothetical protein R3A44_43900 [Caldilineaceae bacterium]
MINNQNGLLTHSEVDSVWASGDYSITIAKKFGAQVQRFSTDVMNEFRHMVTHITRDQDLPKRLSIVSALRGEGVSHTALALGATAARDLERNVCVVDLNWWWPSRAWDEVRKLSPGVSLVLQRDATIDEALVRTGSPFLKLLPSGNTSPLQRPIMARGAALKSLLDELDERFDHLILDIPAILATSDAIPLASLGTCCCMVIRQGVGAKTNTARALDEINHLPMLGVVMNRVRLSTPRWLLKWIPQE